MVSRPLVTGTLAGTVLGDPGTGLLVGALVELLHLGALPAGGARLPEPGPATVPAVAAAAGAGGAEGLFLAVVWGVVGGWIGGASVSLHRTWNEARTRELGAGSWTFPRLARAHWTSLAVDGIRGMVLVAGGLAVLRAATLLPLAGRIPDPALVAGAAVVGGAFALGRLVGGTGGAARGRRTLLLLAGAVAGVALGLWGGGG
jgi:mannose/fructose/N-acetylgalactosamine-specific phosphotransferase system component IIC